jgi:hypothetical protein
MNITYVCGYCETEFNTENECLEHEKICNLEVSYTCDKCGKSESWKTNDDNAWIKSDEWHDINLGRAGYGSSLDGCEVNFTICDDCLTEYIKSFTLEGQEKVFNSGSNEYMSKEDWIAYHKGEMTDEEIELLDICSPRQIKAYEERFPICDKVNKIIYDDDSKNCHCKFGAFGNDDGSTEGHQPYDDCFECDMFNPRKEGQEIPIIYNKSE